MSFYNFKLNDPSTFSTSSSPDTKSPGRFVHKTFQDYQAKPPVSVGGSNSGGGGPKTAPKHAASTSSTVLTTDGRGKFVVPGWKERGVIAPGGEKSRFRLNKPSESLSSNSGGSIVVGAAGQVDNDGLGVGNIVVGGALDYTPPATGAYPPPTDFDTTQQEDPEDQDPEEEDLHAISITTSLQGISRTFSPLEIATLHSRGPPTSIRLVKLAGQSSWHSHPHTDEIFILLRGAIEVLYRDRTSGEEKVARCVGGELLRVPRGWQHCVVAEEGTEVILLEGGDRVGFFGRGCADA